MATKPLKTITFEGLEDTYTIPQIDDTLSVTGASADAKVTGDALEAKAEAEGTVSMAKALVGGKYTLDKSPYHYRQSPEAGSVDETIVGGSLGWNQLCNGSSVTVQSGHKYIAKISGAFSIGASTGTAITGLTSGTDMVTDLTTCFGPTIADYIYSLEQSSAGEGVDWVRQYIDLDTYHEYCEPTLKSVEGLQSRDVVGFNQWDEETADGFWNDDGTANSSSDYIRCKNKIRVVPGASYYLKVPTTAGNLFTKFYDVNGVNASSPSIAKNTVFTIPDGCHYIGFSFAKSAYGTTYNHDICINLSDPSRNGTYEPYEKHSYPLDSSIELRGIPKLSDGKMYFDGDEYQSNGQVTRRYGVVDLGTLDYSRTGSGLFLTSIIPNCKKGDGNVLGNVLAQGYVTMLSGPISGPNSANPSPNMACALSTGNTVMYFNNTAYTDPTTFKAAMSGVMLVFELATPTIESAQPYQSPQLVGSTEEYVTTGVVPVGHESRYYEDVAKKVSGLPKDFSTLIAPTEVTFTATRNYSVGSYLIVKNQLYKVTSAISSGGTITPNSNVTATTIMAEILALA